MFKEKDLELIEINPLVVKSDDNLHCLDAKVVVDSNAVHRQPILAEMRDESQEDPREAHAASWDQISAWMAIMAVWSMVQAW